MVRSFQISAVFPHLTVIENVRIALQRERGGSFDFWRSRRVLDKFNERARALIADVGLSDVEQATAVELPYGRKRALEIECTEIEHLRKRLLGPLRAHDSRRAIDRAQLPLRERELRRTLSIGPYSTHSQE